MKRWALVVVVLYAIIRAAVGGMLVVAAGLSVMLVAFGPATFVLFVRCYASLRPRRPRPPRRNLANDSAQALAPASK